MATNGNLKVDKLLAVRAHVVVEAELVLANIVGREDKVALLLLLALHDNLAGRARDLVVDVERASGLDLRGRFQLAHSSQGTIGGRRWQTHSKVEGDLDPLVVGRGVEARLLVCEDPVRQRRRGDRRSCPGHEAAG